MGNRQIYSTRSTREALLNAAIACFAEFGYKATSIREIASLADKNTSLVLYYFGTKKDLYCEIVRKIGAKYTKTGNINLHKKSATIKTKQEAQIRLDALIAWILGNKAPGERGESSLDEAMWKIWMMEICNPQLFTREIVKNSMDSIAVELQQCIIEIRPDFGTEEIEFWSNVIHGICFGHMLLTDVKNTQIGIAKTVADPGMILSRMSSFVFSGLMNI